MTGVAGVEPFPLSPPQDSKNRKMSGISPAGVRHQSGWRSEPKDFLHVEYRSKMAMAYDPTHDDSDTHSVISAGTHTSTMSKDRVTLECPECGKEVQSRSMFNHIRKLHTEYFKTMYKVWKSDDLQELIDECEPFPVEWEYQNDFDETEFVNIWGCLACNSTFTQEHSAKTHCKKPKCKKDHIKALKAIKKEEETEKQTRAKKASDKRTRWLNRTTEQIFDDTRKFATYYKDKYITGLLTRFKEYFSKLESPEEVAERFAFSFCWDIKLTSDKNEMLEQENRIERYVMSMRTTYLNALKKLYISPTVISDEGYMSLERGVNWVQDLPKMSYD